MSDIPGQLNFRDPPEDLPQPLKEEWEQYIQGLRRYIVLGGKTTRPLLQSVDTTFLIRELIRRMGDDPDRAGLLDTPMRVLNSWSTLFSGYDTRETDPKNLLKLFEEKSCDGMVILSGIEYYSFCEHHLLPYFGKAHIAYIPTEGKVVGISKLARLLEVFSRRLTTQERITAQIVTTLMESDLKPLGAGCVMQGRHFCLCARGVGKQNSIMTTSEMLGIFREKFEVRQEFLSCIHHGSL